MKTTSLIRIAVSVAIACTVALLCNPPLAGGQPKDWTIAPPDTDPVAPGMPNPGEPETPAPSYVPPGFQVVGYTTEKLPADRGVLNMTRACQREFASSRMCSVDEILSSFAAPEVPQHCEGTFVWVGSVGTVASSLMSPDYSNLATERAAKVAQGTEQDCRGWTSKSPRSYGVAMALGSEHGCYGGFVSTSCDKELSIACCATVGVEQ